MTDIVTPKPAGLPSAGREALPPSARTGKEVHPDASGCAMTELVPLKLGLTPLPYDVERLIERWQEGRSPHSVRACGRDLAHFARWSEAATPGEAITRLLTASMGEANERLHAYRGAMLDAGLAPATVNRRLSALRSIVQLGRTFGLITWSLEVDGAGPTWTQLGPASTASPPSNGRQPTISPQPRRRATWRSCASSSTWPYAVAR